LYGGVAMVRLVIGGLLIVLAVAIYFFLGYLEESVRRKLQKLAENRRKSRGEPEMPRRRRTTGFADQEEGSPPAVSSEFQGEEEPFQVPIPTWIRLRWLYAGAILLLGLFIWTTTSWVIIPGDKVGHLDRVFTGKPMEPGQVVAKRGQKGKQARVLAPGFHLSLFIQVIYKIEKLDPFKVGEGSIGRLYARDGVPLKEGEQYAPRWGMDPNNEYYFKKMLDAEYFLEHGGTRGPQLTELPPAEYRICRYLFDVEVKDKVLTVKAGHVAFIKSNVQEVPYNASEVLKLRMAMYNDPNVPIVPRGYKGMWAEVLPAQQYYLHNLAYEPNMFDTRIQAWDFIGGFTKRTISLTMDPNGGIQQKESVEVIPMLPGAVDRAIPIIIEGWEAWQDVRAFVHVEPKDVPYVQAKLGGLEEVQKLFASALRDVFRTVCGATESTIAGQKGSAPIKRRALDLYEKREQISKEVWSGMQPTCKKLHVTLDQLLLGDPGLPPELRLPQIRKQLADQMVETFQQEKLAQDQRKDTEKSRATANMQNIVVAAEMKSNAAEFLKTSLQKEGEGYELNATARSKGEKAMMEVLGTDNTMMLAALKQILEVLKENPGIVKMPAVLVQDGSSGQSQSGGMAVLGSILGYNNVTNMLQDLQNQLAKNPSEKEKQLQK